MRNYNSIGKSMENPQRSAFDNVLMPKRDFLRRGDRLKHMATNMINNLEKMDAIQQVGEKDVEFKEKSALFFSSQENPLSVVAEMRANIQEKMAQ